MNRRCFYDGWKRVPEENFILAEADLFFYLNDSSSLLLLCALDVANLALVVLFCKASLADGSEIGQTVEF